MDFSYITWNVDPEIVKLGFLSLRYYGILFALGFLVGQHLMTKIFTWENRNLEDLDQLLIYMLISTVVGARLGHCLFYEPDYYLSNPLEILMIHKGGLASHGAAAGILLALYLYSRKQADQSYLYILDRIVITVAFGAFCIRLGNLFNSEIIGLPTNVPWAFWFVRVDEEPLPRHPAQLYESLASLLLFCILWFGIYKSYKAKLPEGRIFGLFLIWIFGLRIVWEFFKVNQVDFEDGMLLNMGQILSIPLVIAGVWIWYRSFTPAATPKNDVPPKKANPKGKRKRAAVPR